MTKEENKVSDKELDDLVRSYVGSFRANSLGINGNIFGKMRYSNSVKYGTIVRDDYLHRYSILPGAVQTFMSIASSREWHVLGKPRAAARSVDMLNNSYTIDKMGIRHHGFEQLLSRMCIDWLSIGRCMFRSEQIGTTRNWTPYEYIDVSNTSISTSNQGSYWIYKDFFTGNREISQENMFFADAVRIGSTGAVLGPLAWLVPVAHLDWLIREHDSMQLDGRKIRDLFLVDSEDTVLSIQKAVNASMALSAGEDPSKYGFPVVSISRSGYDGPIEDMFARIGLSEVPREFSREEFENRYAREISATLGLPIGQFWHDPRGTNRALEQVTQERSTLKGPAFFIRSIERMINTSATTGQTPASRSILQFQEETDNASMKNNAEALKSYADAIKNLNEVIQANPDDADKWMSFFERRGLIPPNTTMADLVMMEENSLNRSLSSEEKQEVLDKGWVRMDSDHMILEKRRDFQMQKPEV